MTWMLRRTVGASALALLLFTSPEAFAQTRLDWETGAGKSFVIPALEVGGFIFGLNQVDRRLYKEDNEYNTDAETMAWIYDTYDVMHAHHNNLPVVTGKPLSMGGSLGRREATARGCLFVTRRAAAQGHLPPHTNPALVLPPGAPREPLPISSFRVAG